jgi:SAM-dependent methyltransferase
VSDADQKAWLAGVFDRAAPTYDRLADSYHDHFGERLVDAIGAQPGWRVLDVACGRGAVLRPAVTRRPGRLVGVDFSPEMVRSARAELGARAEVHVMDAEQLGFADGSFDAVLCSFGVFFFPSPERAVSEMYRVLAPGGSVALSTWTQADERWAWEGSLLRDLMVDRRPSSRPFDRSDDLERLLADAGFGRVRSTVETHEVAFVDEAEWWEWKWSYSVRGVLEQVDEAALDAFRTAAFAAMQSLREERGFPMRLAALFTLGEKPT